MRFTNLRLDGDSVTANCGGSSLRIRLAGIDAPELKQQYGVESRSALQDLILQKAVQVTPIKRDRYRRDISRITIDEEDVSSAMIKGGHAWVYDKYPIKALYPWQAAAKSAKRGLWANPIPVAPWKWRKGKLDD